MCLCMRVMCSQDAFWGLVQICEKYLPGYYSAGLVSLIQSWKFKTDIEPDSLKGLSMPLTRGCLGSEYQTGVSFSMEILLKIV